MASALRDDVADDADGPALFRNPPGDEGVIFSFSTVIDVRRIFAFL